MHRDGHCHRPHAGNARAGGFAADILRRRSISVHETVRSVAAVHPCAGGCLAGVCGLGLGRWEYGHHLGLCSAVPFRVYLDYLF